jgi:hypothetical protein
MDAGLSRLITDYQVAVQRGVELMRLSGIPLPSSNIGWTATKVPQRGLLNSSVPYFKHGYGCTIVLPEGEVDFDFGANGETNGFDAWRLARYAEHRPGKYGFASRQELEIQFQAAVNSGSLIYSGYLLYYLPSADP